MWGAIIGDIIGSRFEHHNIKTKKFQLFHEDCRFTDDSTLTVGTADALLHNSIDFAKYYRKWAKKYPNAGYGKSFNWWVHSKMTTGYGSWGNGSAMRVSPVVYTTKGVNETVDLAKKTSMATHNHLHGIKGARCVAYVQWMCKNDFDKEYIREQVLKLWYPLPISIKSIKKDYKFDVSCEGSVPVAIQAFLDSKNFTDAIRIAVSVGGDSDTLAAITGSISQSFYKKVPKKLINKARTYLTPEMLKVIDKFNKKYNCEY
jgi:ADP-ribosylglycohydrolase